MAVYTLYLETVYFSVFLCLTNLKGSLETYDLIIYILFHLLLNIRLILFQICWFMFVNQRRVLFLLWIEK